MMLKLYKYCFYRITRFWDHPVHYSLSYDPLTQKVDPTHLISSMGIVSLLQISNLNTLLILPVLLFGHQLSANLLWIIVVAIAVFNVFILNKEKLYDDCEARWKDEPPKARKRNRWLLIAYFVASAVLMVVSFKIVYLALADLALLGELTNRITRGTSMNISVFCRSMLLCNKEIVGTPGNPTKFNP